MPISSSSWTIVLDELLERLSPNETMVEPVSPSFETYYRHFYNISLGKPRPYLHQWLIGEVAPYLRHHRRMTPRKLDLVMDTLLYPMRVASISRDEFLQHASLS